jgi:uncharacterized membrane protein
VVHFPIGLILTAILVEATQLIRRRPVAGSTAFLCVSLGSVGAVVAALLGWQAGEHADFTGKAAEMLETHRWLGITTAAGSTAVALLCRATRERPGAGFCHAYLAGLCVCGVTLSIGGHYGGMLVFGDDYITSAVPFLRDAPISLESHEYSGSVDFVQQVQPIFEESCYSCHGPEKQRHGLRLDARHLTIRGGRSGRSVIPGDGGQSTVIRRMQGLDDEKRMPKNEDPLRADQIAIVKAWIDQGAHWPDSATLADATIERHWAYVKPERPTQPLVIDTEWVRNPIDGFVLARLEAEGLSPSPEADRITLVRRIYLDLLGLPPTPEEVDAFANDSSPEAYERVVDRLLNSPHYGEHWARSWLDLARYADTDGFNYDLPRIIWKYRDWVIDALNDDMPFDQFTIEQIAGDMLPDATIDQQIATGFHRNTMLNTEAGVDPAEARWIRQLDRVDTTATVWLGTTLACAQCHDHKFDPFSQEDFYQFLAFFESADEPALAVPTAAQTSQKRALEANISALKNQLHSRVEIDKLNKEIGSLGIVSTLVMQDRGLHERASAIFRIKGAYTGPGKTVYADVPSSLHPTRPDTERNRLGLARWLVDSDNPLVGRVTMNRMWGAFFGRPIVESPEDFGSRALQPSHPYLLDWLATDFVEAGWTIKRMHRLIVTSATYRQSSHVDAALLAKDPANRLLARGPRFRMEAEVIRDVMLAAGGMLSAKIGGPSVFPLAPDMTGFVVNNESLETQWKTSPGEDRYRRGLYTVWRRTAPHPSLTTFDAPSREVSTVRRPRTNTPLQALVAMNAPGFFDAARGLARRILVEGGESLDDRMIRGFRLCTSRVPDDETLGILGDAYRREQSYFDDHPDGARRIIESEWQTGETPSSPDAIAELAAWTMTANVLLNMDETITKE